MARRSPALEPATGSGSSSCAGATRSIPAVATPSRRCCARGSASLSSRASTGHRAERRALAFARRWATLGRGRAAHGPGADPRRHLADSPPDRGALRRARDGSGARPRPQGPRWPRQRAPVRARARRLGDAPAQPASRAFSGVLACASPPATNPAAPAWGWAATGTTCSPCPTARWAWRWGTSPARGLRAASVMGQLRTTVRVAPPTRARARTLVEVDPVVPALRGGEMATLLLLSLDPATGRLAYSAAAHPPPLVVAPDAEPSSRGRPWSLGVAPAPRFHEASSRLPPGATVLLYTDGLIERPGQSIDEGFERLREVASLGAADPASSPGTCSARCWATPSGRTTWPCSRSTSSRFLGAGHPPAGPRRPRVAARGAARLAGPAGRANRARRGDHPRLQRGDRQCDGARLRRPRGPCASAPRVTAARSWSRSATPATGGRRADERGRGLGVIDAMMDNVEILKRPEGTEVRMVRRLSSSA